MSEIIRNGAGAERAAAIELMTISNLRLVVRIAGEFVHFGLEIEDLISALNEGLALAVERFDPEKGAKFSNVRRFLDKG